MDDAPVKLKIPESWRRFEFGKDQSPRIVNPRKDLELRKRVLRSIIAGINTSELLRREFRVAHSSMDSLLRSMEADDLIMRTTRSGNLGGSRTCYLLSKGYEFLRSE